MKGHTEFANEQQLEYIKSISYLNSVNRNLYPGHHESKEPELYKASDGFEYNTDNPMFKAGMEYQKGRE